MEKRHERERERRMKSRTDGCKIAVELVHGLCTRCENGVAEKGGRRRWTESGGRDEGSMDR